MQEQLIENFAVYIRLNRSTILRKVILSIGIFIIGYWLITIVTSKIKRRIENNSLQENTYTQNTSKLVAKFISILLTIFLVLAVFQIIGFDTAIIMGGISLSLGFAMETTIGNMIAGIMIMTNKKVKLGDFVQFMGSLKMRGTIEEINIRYTVVRTWDKRRTIIPNNIIAKTPIRTIKSEPLIRGEIVFTVPRHIPFEQIKEIMITTINGYKHIMYPEYTNTWIENFDVRGLEIKSVFFVNPKKKTPFLVTRELKPTITGNLKKYGINIPYEHITLTAEV